MLFRSGFFYWLRLAGGGILLAGLLTYLSSFFIGGEPVSEAEAHAGSNGGGVLRRTPARA